MFSVYPAINRDLKVLRQIVLPAMKSSTQVAPIHRIPNCNCHTIVSNVTLQRRIGNPLCLRNMTNITNLKKRTALLLTSVRLVIKEITIRHQILVSGVTCRITIKPLIHHTFHNNSLPNVPIAIQKKPGLLQTSTMTEITFQFILAHIEVRG